jgi:anti-repressor protein
MLTIVCRRHSLNKTIRIRYCLICRSNKPEAEQFETWVFDELLPRIRQTGGYVNDPVVFVDNWLPNTDAKTKALLVTSLEAVKNQDNIIGVQQESVEFHRAVSASVNSVDFGEFAKCLANDRINIGRNRLMAWLRKEKYIDSANVAYQRYIEQGIFEVKETVYFVGTTYHTSRKTLITPKGQVHLAKKVSKGYKG